MAYTKPFAVKGTNITSPKGKALWCKFKEPDTKFNAKGEYSTGDNQKKILTPYNLKRF